MINLPYNYIIKHSCSILEAISKINELSDSKLLTLLVVDDNGSMIGTITDGDIRRGLLIGKNTNDCISDIVNGEFTWVSDKGITPAELRQIKKKGVKLVPVLNDQKRIVKLLDFANNHSYLPIDAVLMAGGKGERLRPATLTTPKPLLNVGSKPIIDYNIDNLLNNGIENISVTVNYLADQIEEYFKEPRQNGVQINCVREPRYLGTMGSIKFVERWHNDTILVMNSDLFTNINLEDFYLHFMEHDADMSIVAVPYSVNIPYGIFEIENARDIKGVKEKPSFHYYANAGIYLIKKEMLDVIPENEFFNATDFMDKLIENNKKVIRFPLSGYWIDIGKPEDFKKVQEIAQHLQQ